MLPSYVKPQPWYFEYLPWLSRQHGTTILQNIYLRRDIFKDLKSPNPSPRNIAVLEHEMTHYKRIKQMGILKFSMKYLLSGKFRFNEELIANKNAFKILKKNTMEQDLDKKAQLLSGWLYLWPVPYKFAKEELKKAWEDA
ncbi:hypothetical protein HY385_02905 [Candidatus Daviesbacteria bacterium]|nr:hypothetical protein [Candidatus Daviesbacteria bacterium]